MLSLLPAKVRRFNTVCTAVYYTRALPRRKGDAKRIWGPAATPPFCSRPSPSARRASRPLCPYPRTRELQGGCRQRDRCASRCTEARARLSPAAAEGERGVVDVRATKQPAGSGARAGEVRSKRGAGDLRAALRVWNALFFATKFLHGVTEPPPVLHPSAALCMVFILL